LTIEEKREAMDIRPLPPVPTSISDAAQAFLAIQMSAGFDDLAVDDVDAWLERVRVGDGYLIERFANIELPVRSLDAEVDGIHIYVIRDNDVADDPSIPVYLDIHGGAFIMGAGEACRLMSSATAALTGMIHWAVDYRMPPLHPYPAPLDDCMAVYRALLNQRDATDIFVGGGSAGGNLAAALIARAKDEGLPLPAGLVLMTPEVDLTESGDTFATNLGVDNVLGLLMQANLLYADGHDLRDPYLSPLFADVAGFPPTFLQAGTRDLFLSNTVRMHRKLRDAGVDAELHVWEAMPHGGFGGAPEDLEVRIELRRFLDRLRSIS
jgi:acetyl esterase/lipase